jgi:hypothetical protein
MKTSSHAHAECTADLAEMPRTALPSSREQRKPDRRSAWRGTLHKYSSVALALTLLALLSGCTSEPSKPAEPPKPEVGGLAGQLCCAEPARDEVLHLVRQRGRRGTIAGGESRDRG